MWQGRLLHCVVFTKTSEEFAPYYLAEIRHDMRQTTEERVRQPVPPLSRTHPIAEGLFMSAPILASLRSNSKQLMHNVRRNARPGQRIHRMLVMRHQHMAGALGELRALVTTSPGPIVSFIARQKPARGWRGLCINSPVSNLARRSRATVWPHFGYLSRPESSSLAIQSTAMKHWWCKVG
jgi:hypothetical protein